MGIKLFLTGLALTAIVAVSNAQTTANNGRGNGNSQGTNTAFVDENKNSTCDNYENRSTTNQKGKAYKKAKENRSGQGNGQRNGKGNKHGKGQGQFIDANKNGTCDNRE